MAAQTKRYEITDEEWERIKGYFTERAEGQKGRPRAEDRMLLNGILWIAQSGAAWRDLPERYGPWNTVDKHFAQWQESGLFEKILEDLAIDADLQDRSLDSISIKAHQSSAGAKRGI